MKVQNKTISRSYTISQKELQKKLNLEGKIQSINLWSGLSPDDEESGVSPDLIEWEIITHE